MFTAPKIWKFNVALLGLWSLHVYLNSFHEEFEQPSRLDWVVITAAQIEGGIVTFSLFPGIRSTPENLNLYV